MFTIRECGSCEWEKFRKYHYLDTSLNQSAKCYGVYDDDDIIGFCAILHFPHPVVKNMKKVHRIVIMPDYQGIGLGRRFLEFLGNMYHSMGFRFAITTSSKSAIASLMRSKKFVPTRCSVTPNIGKTSTVKKMQNTIRHNAKTVTLEYI